MLVSADYMKKVMMDKWSFKKSTSVPYVSSSRICLVDNPGKIWAVFSKADTSMEEDAEYHSDFAYLLHWASILYSWGWVKYHCSTKRRAAATFFQLQTVPVIGAAHAQDGSHNPDLESWPHIQLVDCICGYLRNCLETQDDALLYTWSPFSM